MDVKAKLAEIMGPIPDKTQPMQSVLWRHWYAEALNKLALDAQEIFVQNGKQKAIALGFENVEKGVSVTEIVAQLEKAGLSSFAAQVRVEGIKK